MKVEVGIEVVDYCKVAVGRIGGSEGIESLGGRVVVAVAVDSDWRSEVDSNVYSDAAGCCILSAMAAGLETAAVDSGSRLVFLVAAKVVADVAAARSLRCMEAADRAVLVDGTESSVNRRSIHSLPSLYMKPLYCRIGVGE